MKGLQIAVVGVMLTMLGMMGGAFTWYDGTQAAEHRDIELEQFASNIELDLQSIDLELKMYRAIQERRQLTPDEADRVLFLKSKRSILLAEQRKQVA